MGYASEVVVKKYSNRRMYDTKTSSYVRLEELAQRIRAGENLRVVDAESGQDLTHSVLVQLVVESRGAAKLFPEPVLQRLARLDDAALAEFLGSWMGWALEMFARARQTSEAATPTPAEVSSASGPVAVAPPAPVGPAPPGTPAEDEWARVDSEVGSGVRVKDGPASKDEVAALRSELEELKDLIRGQAGARKSG